VAVPRPGVYTVLRRQRTWPPAPEPANTGEEDMISLYLRHEGYEYLVLYDEIVGDKLYMYYEDLGAVSLEYLG